MNKYSSSLLLLLVLCSLQAQKSKTFTLDGYLRTNYSDYIYLYHDGSRDSCLVINNRFKFTGTVENYICDASLMFYNKAGGMSRSLYLENKPMSIELSFRQMPPTRGMEAVYFDVWSITGSTTSDIELDYRDFAKAHEKDSNYAQELYAKIDMILTSNPQSPVASGAIFEAMYKKVFSFDQVAALYAKVDPIIISSYVRLQIENYLMPEKFVKDGDPIFNFSLPDKNGRPYNTETLKGKWILIHFWASWCGPCHEALPDMKKLYNLYKSKNFELVAVSIDKKKESWIKDLNKQDTPWINLIEDQDLTGPVAWKYHVNGVPFNVLINPEGKVVGVHMELEMVEAVIK